MNKQSAKPKIARRGLLLVLSSPSGAGKTTLSKMLLSADSQISLSISVTTRSPRPGEVDGRDYHFITKQQFDALVEKRELLEWAKVFDHFYGTPKAPVEKALADGRDVMFDIDWQGTQQVAQVMEDDLVRIFILPPDAETLRERLISRKQDAAAVIAKRMAEAPREISHWAEYDFVVVNADLNTAHAEIVAILKSERLRRKRQTGLTEFVRQLSAKL